MANPWDGLSTTELLRQLDNQRFRTDPLIMATQLFPHHFEKAPASFHAELTQIAFHHHGGVLSPSSPSNPPPAMSAAALAVCSSPGSPPAATGAEDAAPSDPRVRRGLKLALAAPRGFAKSTLMSFLLPMWSLCLKQRHFILLVSNTEDQGIEFLKAIKKEWETNMALRQQFPEITPTKEKWSETSVEFTYPGGACKLSVKGVGAQLRGLKFLQYRPDLIVIDDGENDEMVRSEQRRGHYQWWLDHVVLPTNPNAVIVMVGTILHEASLLNRIIRQPEAADRRLYSDWTTKLYRALDEGGSTWAGHQTTADLEAERARDPLGFSQEKQNEPVAADYQPFKPEYFSEQRWYQAIPDRLTISITLDPACTDRDYSDYTALCVAGWDAQGQLWVLDVQYGKYTNPSDIIAMLMDAYVKWGVKNPALHPHQTFYTVGIEKIAFQKFLIHLFKQECTRRGLHPFVKELAGDRDKTRRIWQLEPLFRHNRIFLRPDLSILEAQLKSFPRGQHDDMIDALAYHLQLGQVLPEAAAEPTPQKGMTMKEYVGLAESTALLRQRYPELSGVMAQTWRDPMWSRN